jgi:hypothetical protein
LGSQEFRGPFEGQMFFQALADLVLIVHFGFIAFALLGALLALRWPGVLWAHAPAAVWAVAIELGGWICPLTPLENRLRSAGGAAGYPGGFIEHYLLPLIHPPGLTREVQIVLGLALFAINVLVYWMVWCRWRKRLA